MLAVSGGIDSMVMFELFYQSSYPFAVAHCNFGLRGEESDADEEFVLSRARQQGIDVHSRRIEITGSIQMEARNRRYRWFFELAKAGGYSKIATAHHLDDSLETTLFNLSRGTGIKGIAGIPIQSDQIIRPLLFASREEIMAFAIARQLRWREDSSNSATHYDRNKIRKEVVPVLQSLNPSLQGTYKFTKERMDLMTALLAERVEEIRSEFYREQDGVLQLSWMKSPHDVLILNELLTPHGFNYVTSKEVYQAIGKPGKVFQTSKWHVSMDRDSLFIQSRETVQDERVVIDRMGTYAFGNQVLEVTEVKVGGEDVQTRDLHTATLDVGKLAFPLLVRRWKKGDSFQPLGMQGQKKVSDLLIDLKVPRAKKNDVFVLESAGVIAWVIGLRISDQFKLDGVSEKAWAFTLQR